MLSVMMMTCQDHKSIIITVLFHEKRELFNFTISTIMCNNTPKEKEESLCEVAIVC